MNIPLDDVSKDKNFINAIKYTVRLYYHNVPRTLAGGGEMKLLPPGSRSGGHGSTRSR